MTLGLVNATNARDLGGLPTVDGRRVRSGLVFRANALDRLTDADLAAVGRLGLSCVVDLRSAREVAMIGADRLPTPAPQLIALPLSDPDNEVFASVTAILKGDPSIAGAHARLKGDPSIAGAHARLDRDVLHAEMLRAYRWIATSEPALTAFATVLRFMTEPYGLPLLFHCSAGKDRTGWLAAVLLSALGVDRDTITANYLATNEYNRDGIAYVLSRLEGKIPDPTVIQPMLDVRPEYLAEAFTAVEEKYADMTAYVRDGLELEDAVVTVLREKLLE